MLLKSKDVIWDLALLPNPKHFDQTHQTTVFSRVFHPKFFWQIFSWNQSCQQPKSPKPQHFHEFLKQCSVWHFDNFRIYDIDNDGYISNGELFQVLKMMVGSNLKDTQLQQIVDKTILFADKDEDGKINFEEFCEVVGNTDVHKKMVVDV